MLIQTNLSFETPLELGCGERAAIEHIYESQVLDRSSISLDSKGAAESESNKRIKSLMMQTLFNSDSTEMVYSKHFKKVFAQAMDFSGFDEFMIKEQFQTL
jgi:hypothetical protein